MRVQPAPEFRGTPIAHSQVSMILGRSSVRLRSQVIALGLAAICGAAAGSGPEITAEEIVDKMLASEAQQQKNLPRYRTMREYRLTNADGSKQVEVLAKISYDRNGKKRIEVVEERGSEGLFRRAIHKVLDAEMKASREARKDIQISPDNYEFKLVGTGGRSYVLDLIPKRKSKFLIEGRIWVDAQDFAISRIKGRPAANISFWVGRPHITQSFQKVGDVWLLAHNESTTTAKVVGRVVFTMETLEVESSGTKLALKHAPRPRRSAPPLSD
jgi:hypothetical protein